MPSPSPVVHRTKQPPQHVPAFACRDGYVSIWSCSPRGHIPCAAYAVDLPCSVVETLFVGAPLARSEALFGLSRQQIDTLFPRRCACGKSHHKAMLAVQSLHYLIYPQTREFAKDLPLDDLRELAAITDYVQQLEYARTLEKAHRGRPRKPLAKLVIDTDGEEVRSEAPALGLVVVDTVGVEVE